MDEISSGGCGASVGGTEPHIHNPSFKVCFVPIFSRDGLVTSQGNLEKGLGKGAGQRKKYGGDT